MFSRKHSTITKGILIILMLAHHLFSPDNMVLYEVKTILPNPVLVTQIVTWFKICVAGFSFLSAFGITRSLMQKQPGNASESMSVMVNRLIKLESAVVILYIFAALYRQFVMKQPLSLLYAETDLDTAHIILCMCIDALGLAAYAGIPAINVTWWYLSYAVLLIVVMPFLFKAYENSGIFCCPPPA